MVVEWVVVSEYLELVSYLDYVEGLLVFFEMLLV